MENDITKPLGITSRGPDSYSHDESGHFVYDCERNCHLIDGRFVTLGERIVALEIALLENGTATGTGIIDAGGF